ncbi:MAG: MMPL family transporter [Flavobacteriales bacterium]|nr:MMPL family transporter [Flavobacteriales bacterium]
MWEWLASRVLRNRTGILIALGTITLFMGWKAREVRTSFKHGGLLPKNDSAYIVYQQFLQKFSEDGNVIVLGVEDRRLYQPEFFTAWWQLGNDLKKIDGIDSVFSEAHLFDLVRDDSLKRFRLMPVMTSPPGSQAEMDTILTKVRSLPFYRGLLYNDSTGASLMMVFVDARVFDTNDRDRVIDALEERVSAFEQGGIQVHRSGLPYIRVRTTQLLQGELPMFVGLAVGVTALLLLLFFRSWRVMLYSLLVVLTSVVWAFGTMALLGFELNILTSVVPPLLIVIGVPNCVFLINKYHHEYVRHNNKVRALQRVISRVGTAAFMTNATTALGFGTFMLTYSDVLRQFGIIAALNIMLLFVLALLLIPILFSFQAPPKPRHTSHLDRRWLDKAVEWIVRTVKQRRTAIYVTSLGVLAFGLIGLRMLKNQSRIVDDLPKDGPVLTDLHFFERNFKGVMPLELMIDAKKKGYALKEATLRRIEKLSDTLETYPVFSRPLSIVEAVKFTKQAFYGGNPERYQLIRSSGPDRFILPYLQNLSGKQDLAKAFLDSSRQTTRLTVQMADVGTQRMDKVVARLRPQIDSIFDPLKYRVTLTGTSMVFLKGTAYMVSNLVISLAIAIVVIGLLMALIFNSARMVLVSLVPNLLPLIVTGGLMGYLGIPIKPSTILVFSIAFGIAVDNAIHFLSKYRLELRLTGHDLRRSVELALRETSIGVIYTAVVLFCGFSMFILSEFGGVKAMGTLISITLGVAMFTNLLVLPALLLSFERSITTKAFDEPLLEILDEEDDIDMQELHIEGHDHEGPRSSHRSSSPDEA